MGRPTKAKKERVPFSARVDLTFVVTVHNARTARHALNKICKLMDDFDLNKILSYDDIEFEKQDETVGFPERLSHEDAFTKISDETTEEYFEHSSGNPRRHRPVFHTEEKAYNALKLHAAFNDEK